MHDVASETGSRPEMVVCAFVFALPGVFIGLLVGAFIPLWVGIGVALPVGALIGRWMRT